MRIGPPSSSSGRSPLTMLNSVVKICVASDQVWLTAAAVAAGNDNSW